MDFTKIAWLAWLAPLAMMWSQVRSTLTKGVRLLIRVDTFPPEAIPVVEAYMRKHGVYISGSRSWAMTRTAHKKYQSLDCRVMADARDVASLYLMGRLRIPAVWNVSSRKLTYLAGVIDRKVLLGLIREAEKGRFRRNFDIMDSFTNTDSHFGSGFSEEVYVGSIGRDVFQAGRGGEVSPEPRGSGSSGGQPAKGGSTSQPEDILSQRWGFHDTLCWWDGEELALDGRKVLDEVFAEEAGAVDARLRENYEPYVMWGPLEEVFADFRRWAFNERWYRQRGMCWRRGCLLYGPPGTGKSELALALAHRFNSLLVRAELQTMQIRDLKELGTEVCNRRAILLIEDIDAVFEGRENTLVKRGVSTMSGNPLTFEAFINFIGGVSKLPGCYVIVTTNNPDTLDPALTRPGRLDTKVEIPLLEEADGRKFAERILRDESAEEIDGVLASLHFPAPTVNVIEAATEYALEKLEKQKHLTP